MTDRAPRDPAELDDREIENGIRNSRARMVRLMRMVEETETYLLRLRAEKDKRSE